MPTPAGEWTHRYFTYFWDQRLPHVVKWDMETRTATLLDRDPTQTPPLRYAGVKPHPDLHGRIELRLEASMLNGTLYSLSFEAARPRDLVGHIPTPSKLATVGVLDEPRFLSDSERIFRGWLHDMHVTEDPGSVDFAAGDRYERLVRAALEWEVEQAGIHEDEAAIAAAQQAVLSALRAGKRYYRAHRGGATYIQFEDGALAKRYVGDSVSVETYSSEPDMLAFLRSFFDFEACRDTYPHKPPEAEIWKYIGYQIKS